MISRTNCFRLVLIVCGCLVVTALCAPAGMARLVYLPAEKLGSHGSGPGQLSGVSGVAVDESSDDVYVTDFEGNRIERFDSSGKFISEFNGGETPQSELARPQLLAVDNSNDAAKGRVYVEDTEQNVVDAFEADGKYKFQIAVENPKGITTDTSGHLWILTELKVLEEYSEAGELMLQHYLGPGYAQPGLAVDDDGNIYALPDGHISRYSPPEFIEDNGVHISGSEEVSLAVDPATNKIIEGTSQPASIRVWPAFGEGPGLWQRVEETFSFDDYPGGIAVNGKNGRIYVTQFSAGEVEVFKHVVIPDVSTGAASVITSDGATLEGTVDPDRTATKYFIEWGETESYGHSTPVQTGEGEAPVPFSAELEGLEADTTYHYRVVAINENDTVNGSDATFTTATVPAVVEGASAASDPTRSTVVLHATINTKHSNATYHFRYVEEADYDPTAIDPYSAGGVTANTALSPSSAGQTVEQLAGGLKPATTYHYQLVVINQAGVVAGADGKFTTGAGTPPTATTGAASNVAQNAATIAGSLDTGGLPTTYGFEIATSTDYGPPTGLGTIGAGLHGAAVSLTLSGLQPGTTYHYRLTATNLDGTSYGADQTFTTSVFASTFATPPAPLPFVEVPAIAFPAETHVTVNKNPVKKKTKSHAKKKTRKKKKKKS